MTFTCDLFEEYRRSSNTGKNGFLYDFDLSDVNSSKYRYFQKV